MRYASDLALRFAGRPVAVIGGGPSALQNLHLIKDCAAFVSANEHGCLLRPCDFIAACDIVHTVTKEDMLTRLRAFDTPIVSPLFYADYLLNDWDYTGNSGMHAIYVAWLLGGWPIVAIGMDCYVGDSYHHAPGKTSNGHRHELEYFENQARDLSAMIPDARVRLVESPLTTWPSYDVSEAHPEFAPSAALVSKAQRPQTVRVRATQNQCLWKNPLRCSHIYELTTTEAAKLQARRLVEPLARP